MPIRTAHRKDGGPIEALLKSVPGVWQSFWRGDAVERALASADGLALVAEENGCVVGFICGHDNGFRAYLSELVVSESWQRRGLGSALLATLEQSIAQRGCQLVVADVYPPASFFYRGLGWREPQAKLLCHETVGVYAAQHSLQRTA